MGGTPPTGGTGGTPEAGTDGGAADAGETCDGSGTQAVHVVANIQWPAMMFMELIETIAGGSGELHLWIKSTVVADETPNDDGSYNLTSESQSCGTVLPPLDVLLTSTKAIIDIPDEIWDAESMPVTTSTGTISGNEVGAIMSMEPSATAIGVEMADPMNDPWPATGQEMVANGVDHDGDGRPGITGIPRNSGEYAAPPLDAVGALTGGPYAGHLDLATRTVIALEGELTSCTSASGTATISKFDNHILGCQELDGSECDETQADFVDSQRSIYEVLDATYESVQVPDGATCADVRAAFPMTQ